MKRLVVVMMLGMASIVHGQDGSGEQAKVSPWNGVVFHMDRTGVEPGHYTIQIQPNGLGAYWIGPPEYDLAEAVGVMKLQVSQRTVDAVASVFAQVKQGNCETKIKNIAQTGKKTILFESAGTSMKCDFNYSDDAGLNRAVEIFESMAATMQFGARLQREHRFDKLALDAEMASLVNAVKEGRALEVGNIASVLQSIAEDERVIGRARRQAAWLLENAGKSAAVKGAGE
ncbi:MAG: hypothetical protein V4555_13200 [Acidobacteriota bacterium]